MTDRANESDNPGKFQDIIKRRLRKGQAYSQPCCGTRECTAHFGLWEGGEIPTISETRDLGLMLYDMDFSDLNDIQPMFFRAKLEKRCTRPDGLRGDQMILQALVRCYEALGRAGRAGKRAGRR